MRGGAQQSEIQDTDRNVAEISVKRDRTPKYVCSKVYMALTLSTKVAIFQEMMEKWMKVLFGFCPFMHVLPGMLMFRYFKVDKQMCSMVRL